MTFLELAEKRYSCRSISDKPVEEEKIPPYFSCGKESHGRLTVYTTGVFLLYHLFSKKSTVFFKVPEANLPAKGVAGR